MFSGEYAGFDETQLTAESGGKGKVIAHLKEQFSFKNVVMIGDGATDMEACPPAVSTKELVFCLKKFFFKATRNHLFEYFTLLKDDF